VSRIRSVVAALAAVVALAVASPVGAITYGQPDAGEHPYVGFMIFFDASDPGWFSCSGTLLDSDTFLTAGHCTFPVATNVEENGTPGGNDVWVTFDPTDVLAGWPARADYPDEESLYEARSAWLNNNPEYVKGVAIPDPKYNDFAGFPVNYDIGVVQLDDDVVMQTYGVLAPLGTSQTMASVPSKRNNALVETVGYGIQAIQPHPMEVESRYKSTSRIVEVNGSIARGGNLHTLNNPSAIGGVGGSCFGDSGGPVFVNNTNQVLAVVSFGFSGTCHGADYSWRVDTQPAYDFILPFVDR
jgi:hypothetical protein